MGIFALGKQLNSLKISYFKKGPKSKYAQLRMKI